MFEGKLLDNIQKIAGITKIKNIRGRLISFFFPAHHKLKQVFGLVSYSPAIKIEKDFEIIKTKALELLAGKEGTFKIEPKRSDKRFSLTSPEINIALGKFIEANTSLKFEGQNPQHLLGLEINQEGAYLFLEVFSCFGGLPTGVEGTVGLLVEDEASLLAGLMFMKRGCALLLLAFSPKDISLLQKFSPTPLKIYLVKNWEELNSVLHKNKLFVLVSGQNFDALKKYETNVPVLRPLIAYEHKEISRILNDFSI